MLLSIIPADSTGEVEPIALQQASPNDPWTFRGSSDLLNAAGDWQITATIQRAGVDSLNSPFALTASDDGLRPTAAPAPVTSNERTSTALWLAIIWLLGALTLATAAWQMRRRERPALSFGLLTLSVLAAAMGSVLLVL